MLYIIPKVTLVSVLKLKQPAVETSLVNTLKWSLKGKTIFELLYLE